MKTLFAILILPLSSCQSNTDSEFPKLTETEKQAFKLMNP
jgi:hypothetical protein